MKAKDQRDKYRDMTETQLDDELKRLAQEQFALRLQRATGQLENTARMRLLRRDIARVKTILRQKSAAAATA